MTKTRVVNKYKERYDVYIGRPSIWGNPFPLHDTKDPIARLTCINLYRNWFNNRIESDPAFKTATLALKGKVLACVCKPLDCHGDVIVAYLESLEAANA